MDAQRCSSPRVICEASLGLSCFRSAIVAAASFAVPENTDSVNSRPCFTKASCTSESPVTEWILHRSTSVADMAD